MSDGDKPDDSSKTEDPTPKRLEESRRKGQVALSRELNSWLMLLTATILIMTLAHPVMSHTSQFLRTYLEQAHAMPGVPGGFSAVLGGAFWEMLKILALPLMLLMLAAFLGPFLQVGPIFAPEVIKPELSKLSISKGFGRLFSLRAIMEFVKGILKIAIVSAVSVMLLYPFFGGIEHMVGLPLLSMLGEMKVLVLRMMAGTLIAFLIIAAIDVVYQRIEYMKKMRMTKQELKEEYRQTEGDPLVKAKLRQLRSEKARQRMMQNVPKADVVITNPTHFAVALQYNPDTMDAPICLAKGMDQVALRIREIARENDVTIYESPPLARILYSSVEVDETIPAEHYKAVAQVISFVFKLKGRLN
ncbi:MAG TPA: flagellar biosynthesis protein FlhB [Micavibrio sp.]